MTAKFPWVRRTRLEALRQRCDSLSEECKTVAAELVSAEKALTGLASTLGLAPLRPVAICRTEADWLQFCTSPLMSRLQDEDEAIVAQHQFDEEWELAGYSSSACKIVNFKVDSLSGGRREGNRFIPNLRERLVCPISGLNNRQRLASSLISAELSQRKGRWDLYFTEQITDFYKWACKRYPNDVIFGSEYLGDDFAPGQVVDGVRHEDLHRLSFADSSLDLVVSNDVMEHVHSPRRAFQEIARVLRPGGQALMTFPFSYRGESVVRAELADGSIAHRLEPVYHGNPASADGSLVFTDFGWDVLDMIRSEGFRDASIEIHHSTLSGHLGLGPVFRLLR